MRKIQKDQSGVAHLLMVVLLVVVIAVIGFAGYEVTKKNKTTTKSNTVSNTTVASQQSACQQQLNDETLCKFDTNMSKLNTTSYSFVMTASDGTNTSVTTMKSDGKGNLEGSIKTQGFNYDIITVPKYTFVKNDDGSWTRYPADSSEAPPADDPLKDFKLSENNDYTEGGKLSYKKMGQEACGNLTCYKYEVTDKTDPSAPMVDTVWFDTKNYQLRRMSYKDPLTAATVDMTITFENVTVTAPANYTDFKAGP